MLNRSLPVAKLAAVAAVLLAMACQRDVGLTSTLSVRTPLSSSTSEIVFVQVEAEQDGVTQRATPTAGADVVTLSLKAGIPAAITGTVFTFAPTQWRSFSNTQVVTPEVGTGDVELTLTEEPPVSGSLVPTVTVHGAPAGLEGEALAITLHDVDTDFLSETPFTTGQTIRVPSGRPVIFSVPDRFSGGSAERSVDTSAFTGNTQIALSADATLGIQGDDLPALITALGALGNNNLGLQCAVDGDCTSGSFTACSPATITLETERSYEVSVRYSEVPGSCETTRVTRDLTPPSFTASWSPPFVQPSVTSLTLSIVAEEPIDPAGVSLTAVTTSNRCTPTAVSPTRVDCAVDLSGLDLSKDLQLQTVVTDRGAQQATRTLVIHTRSAEHVQVVGVQTIPEKPSIVDQYVLVGITVAALDGQPLCGVGSPNYVFAAPNGDIGANFQTFGSYSWYGPAFAPATATGTPNIVTYWSRINMFADSTALDVGVYAMSGQVPVVACGTRGAETAQLNADIELVDSAIKWLSGGPLVIPSLPSTGVSSLPAIGYQQGGDGFPPPDDLTPSDPSILFANVDYFYVLQGRKPGTVRLTATPEARTTPQPSSDIDVTVVAPPDILALQAGRLVRRSHSSDIVTPLPTTIGDTLRVFWESERESIIVVGSLGVWVQDATGAATTVLAPCGADTILDATLTASAPAHASAMRDLALLVSESDAPHHCELDLTALTTTVHVPIETCAVTRIAGDTISGQFFAAGDACAMTYVASSTVATTLQSTTFVSDGTLKRAVLDERAALAVILTGNYVYGFDLFGGGFVANSFDFTRSSRIATFFPTAIAIDPATGVPMIAGFGNDSANGSTVFLGYTDHLGQQPPWLELPRADPNATTPPTTLLFDTAAHALYSSRPGNPSFGVSASMLVVDVGALVGPPSGIVDNADRPIRAWPDGLDVVDMVMAGPQPTGLSTALADVGQRVTVTGSGFNGGGRDAVFVLGIPAQVVTSTRDSVTFVMPQELHALTVAYQSVYSYRSNLQVFVRSSGMLSGPVPVTPYADYIDLPVNLPGAFIASYAGGTVFCDVACSAGASLVDTLGGEGLFEVRRPGDDPGVALVDPSTYYPLGAGFLAPVRVPGPRRVVGYTGTSLVDFWPTTFDQSPSQPFAAERSASIGQAAITAVTPSPDGRVLAVADGSGIGFVWASTFTAHPAGHVATAIAAKKLTFTSTNLVVGAAADGSLAAVRFDAIHPTSVAIASDTSACPSGVRSEVLAFATDVAGANVLLVSRYGTALASEAVNDDGTNVTHRCLSTGSMTNVIAGAINAATIDRSGRRVVLLAGFTGYLYDTADMRLPMGQADTANTVTGVFLPERGEGLVFYDATAYYPQPLIEQ